MPSLKAFLSLRKRSVDGSFDELAARSRWRRNRVSVYCILPRTITLDRDCSDDFRLSERVPAKSSMSSLSEELAKLANPTPVFKDPEDDSEDETKARVVEGEDENVEVQPSSLRRKVTTILADTDKRYAGKRTSRNKLDSDGNSNDEDDFDDEDGSDDNVSGDGGSSYGDKFDLADEDVDEQMSEKDEDDDIAEFQKKMNLKTTQSQSEFTFVDNGDYGQFGNDVEEEEEETDGEEEEDDDEDMEEGNDEEEEEEGGIEEDLADEDVDATLKSSLAGSADDSIRQFSAADSDEVAKGKAAKQQLGLWDTLMEGRIKLQKVVSQTNQLPQVETWPVFTKQVDNFSEEAKNTQKSLKTLLDGLIYLQDMLLLQNKETASIVTGVPQSSKPVVDDEDNEEIPSDTEDEEGEEKKPAPVVKAVKRKLKTSEYPEFLAKRHRDFQSYRDATIQKWNDKTKLAGGNMKAKSFGAFDQSALTQINHILADHDRLLKRTQLKRSVYRILGKEVKVGDKEILDMGEERLRCNENDKDYDDEIFDDDDFYHQLLRELIEKSTANTSDPVALSRQWLQIQKLRKKTKKKVETQASKGRKTRFDIHKKLVNFMGPAEHSTWSEEAKDDLFKSLFGKRFASAGT